MDSDEFFMRFALEGARQAFEAGEVPVGAVLVLKNKIIATGRNRVEELKDASAHAELGCLREGARVLGNWRLLGATLYSTLEPCAMCAGALILFRVKAVVWGAKDVRHGAGGSICDVLGLPHPIHRVESRGGVLEEESAELLREFFRKRRGRSIGSSE